MKLNIKKEDEKVVSVSLMQGSDGSVSVLLDEIPVVSILETGRLYRYALSSEDMEKGISGNLLRDGSYRIEIMK